MEKEGNQLFISAEIFRWSFIEIDQAQEFPQNGREMSNKHPWKYNHKRIIKILKGALFVPISHFSWEAQSRFFLSSSYGRSSCYTVSRSKVGETMFEEGLKRPLPEGEENEKDNLQRK